METGELKIEMRIGWVRSTERGDEGWVQSAEIADYVAEIEKLRAEIRGTPMSIVRDNLMNVPGYEPYCGGATCRTMPRARFNGKQFKCHSCGWESNFEAAFIEQYRAKNPVTKPYNHG